MPPRKRDPASFRTLGELERLAERSVDPDVWGYIQGGSGAERTRRANEAAFDRWVLRPDELAGVTAVDLRTTLLGREVNAPFFVAPMAYQREVHPGGERSVAAAGARFGILGVYSTLSSDSLEAIAGRHASGPAWFQLYFQPKLEASLALVRRAERAGYSAVVVTVDTPVLGSRDRQLESGFGLERVPSLGNGPTVRSPPRGPAWDGAVYRLEGRPVVTWEAVDAVRGATELPLVVKGILRAETAREAVDRGAQAVIVSNHGGRQLDRAPAALDALPEVVEAVGQDAEVYLDGGVRRGSDILVALALGARAVGVGRPVLWALAAGGEAGVGRYLSLLGTELANSLLLLGRASVREVDRSSVLPAPAAWAGPSAVARGGGSFPLAGTSRARSRAGPGRA